jgi:hypothetical protein
MFTKLATLADGRRRHRAALAPVHSNISRRDRARAVTSRQAGRYVVVCRWFSVPTTGKLECRWEIEPVAETPAEGSGPRWGKGDRRRVLGVRLRGKRTRLQRAA